MEQLEGFDQLEIEDKGLDRNKRILGAILEYHLRIMEFYLKNYKQHIEKYWDSDTVAEKEEFFKEFTRNVQLSCGLISDLFASDQWKKQLQFDVCANVCTEK
jgi:hypothetical protein